jgi:thiamine-monophosphate kinase
MNSAEDRITEWFAVQRPLDPARFPIAIGDDMAQVNLGAGKSVLITTDMLLEGTHFDLSEASLEQVGYKSMAASLSDCAAMATRPLAAVVSVGLPAGYASKQLKQLHKGILRAADKYDCPLAGGDITSWQKNGGLAVNVAMLSVPAGCEPLTRKGAKVGDCICVTGPLGGSRAGKHLDFEPRVEEAIAIASSAKANSMMDISDGLSSDLARICHQSKVGALLFQDAIPISEAAARTADPLASALNDGEDYELLFTLPENEFKKLLSRWHRPVALTCIGSIVEGRGVKLRDSSGHISSLKPAGYDHLSKKEIL